MLKSIITSRPPMHVRISPGGLETQVLLWSFGKHVQAMKCTVNNQRFAFILTGVFASLEPDLLPTGSIQVCFGDVASHDVQIVQPCNKESKSHTVS